ncbi:hypothetical protein NYE59_01475 [Paenibacillus sp. FSL L8-0323]|uniref:hypothetical protein n=1 Tax=Paenibacillus sp. FSL L8-0323 TaxID=2975330 RepID=UPI0030F4C2B5
MKDIPNNRLFYLEAAKAAKAAGNLSSVMLRVYLMNYVRAYRREQAAIAVAAREKLFEN